MKPHKKPVPAAGPAAQGESGTTPGARKAEFDENSLGKLSELAYSARREMLGAAAANPERPPMRSLTDASRLEEIRARVKSGYYNQVNVQQEIVDKLTEDWEP